MEERGGEIQACLFNVSICGVDVTWVGRLEADAQMLNFTGECGLAAFRDEKIREFV